MLADLLHVGASEHIKGFVLGVLSNIAYDADVSRRRARFANAGFEERRVIDCDAAGWTGLEAYVLRHGQDEILVFRGSQEGIDFLTDLDLTKAPIDDILVHRGFARSAWRFMRAFHNEGARYDEAQGLWVTGHSLGGAIAQVVGYLLHKLGADLVCVTTFGSLRVGGKFLWTDRLEAAGLSERYVRWVNGRDIAPRVPFIGLQPQNWVWLHIGRLHTIDKDGGIIRLDDRERLSSSEFIPSLNDHSMSGVDHDDDSGYLRNLLDFMPAREAREIRQAAQGSLKSALATQHAVYSHDPADRLSALKVDRANATLLSTAVLLFN